MRSSRLRGFILPTSLLVLTLLTVMLTAAFVLVSAEFRSTENSMAGTRALAIAQAGLQSYFASNRSLQATSTYDSLRYNYSGGYVDVVARKMRMDLTGVTNWVIRSTGTTTDPLLAGQITARRIIGQMATLNPVDLPARAAMVALNGVNVMGSGVNPLDGNDWNGALTGCPFPGGPGAADTMSLATITGGYYTQNSGWASPAPGGEGIETFATMAALFDSTHIDWAQLLAGNFTPDYIATSGNLPANNNTTWSIGYAPGDLTLPNTTGSPSFPFNQRQGVLIVAGDLTLAHGAHWDGIIIVGGNLRTATTLSQYLVHGYVLTGLNCITSTCPSPNVLYRGGGSGSSPYRAIFWSWCWAHTGIQLLTTMQPRKNTFIDNWAAY